MRYVASTIITNAQLYTGVIGGHLRGGAVRFENGHITNVGLDPSGWGADSVIDAEGAPVVPGYIDIHHHGAGGAAYDEGLDAGHIAVAEHRKHGTTRCVASFVTASLDDLSARMDALMPLVEDRSGHVLGFHAEGPFLSPAHKGAHPENRLVDPLPDKVQKVIDSAHGRLLQVTLAPERENGINAVQQIVDSGARAAVGHTACDFDTARAAFDAGATILTHTFNGMEGIHHRNPGPVIAALRDERVWLEVINDGIHVDPNVVKSLFLEAPNRTVLVTDAMSATCNPDGHYMLGELEVVVTDGVARLASGGSLAGSTLTMDRAVANAVHNVDVPLDVAVAAATSHAAQAIGLGDCFGQISPGFPADIVLLDPMSLLPQRVFEGGVEHSTA